MAANLAVLAANAMRNWDRARAIELLEQIRATCDGEALAADLRMVRGGDQRAGAVPLSGERRAIARVSAFSWVCHGVHRNYSGTDSARMTALIALSDASCVTEVAELQCDGGVRRVVLCRTGRERPSTRR
jgi:hypothetical protein